MVIWISDHFTGYVLFPDAVPVSQIKVVITSPSNNCGIYQNRFAWSPARKKVQDQNISFVFCVFQSVTECSAFLHSKLLLMNKT